MTESIESDPVLTPAPEFAAVAAPPAPPAPPVPVTGAAPAYAGTHLGAAPIGKIRGTGACVLLTIVTLGVYTWYWYYQTHDEMKRHSGQGMGGGLALVLAIFVGIAMPFVTPSEVGGLYERRGEQKPVSGATGFWVLLPLLGSLIWFVKTNGALNAYWRSVGAQD